jgi:hypothetical protein
LYLVTFSWFPNTRLPVSYTVLFLNYYTEIVLPFFSFRSTRLMDRARRPLSR